MDQPASQPNKQFDKPEPTVVGIGASAGGLAALKTFFAHVPEESNLAFVVVVHLSPEHKSHLAELLQPQVKMPVQQVTRTVLIEPNRVYVIPPNANLSTIDTHLRLSELEEKRRERAPIDHFFRTLAKTHNGHAIGVILSGTGSDGTLGIKEIKEKGGLVVVQAPNEAEYDGMPQSAIATGLVDLILPLAKIPGAVLRFARTEPKVVVPEDGRDLEGDERRRLHKVLTQIRARTGRDFSRYKQSTVMRRISRRMQMAHLEQLADYLDYLRTQPEEVHALADDLLITVTNFFRDPAVFEKLEEEIIPRLFKGKGADDEIRVWSVGCATGEEAYSLTMLLLEAADRLEAPPRLQIFASDLHEHSLAKAREGFYPGDIETDVSPARLRRFFTKENGDYRIRKEVRELVVFAPHNLLSDPPFSRLDLIACRNVLIYLQRDFQHDVTELFHYALRPEGFLVLGTSETMESADLFRVEDKQTCIYRRRNVPGPELRLPVFPLTRTSLSGEPVSGKQASDHVAYGPLHQRLVERYAPPSLLVSPDHKIVHLSDHAGRYLKVPGGEPTLNVFKLIREELRIELQTLLHAAREKGENALRSKPVSVRFNGETGRVVLHVRPALEPQQEGFALVIFDEQAAEPEAAPADATETAVEPSNKARISELEAELALSRQRLQAIIEEYETSQEEMKAANEEMQSANEELRSTMEELETSKEELQSMNEELQTVNQENRHKVEELAQLSSDLQNLMAATNIATLFLDRELRILRFTPRVGELFNIRQTDRGRPLSDLTHRLLDSKVLAGAGQVLDTLIPVEREVEDEAGQWYLTRILPYRSTEDRIEGVVITFVDITKRKRAEEALRKSEARQVFLLQLSDALRPLAEPVAVQAEACRLLGEHLGVDRAYYVEVDEKAGQARVHQNYLGGNSPSLIGAFPLAEVGWTVPYLRRGEVVVVGDTQTAGIVPEADRGWMAELRMQAHISMPIIKEGELMGALCVTEPAPRDWTEMEIGLIRETAERIWAALVRARAEEALRASEARLQRMINVEGVGVLTFDQNGTLTGANDAFLTMTGYSRAEIEAGSLTWRDLTPAEYVAVSEEQMQRLKERGRIGPYEKEYLRKDGSRSWMLFAGADLGDGTIIEYCIDVNEKKQAEEQLRESETRYRQALKYSPITLAWVDEALRYEWIFNPHSDFDPSTVVGKRDDELDSGPGIEALAELKRRVLEHGEQERQEITFGRSGGERTYDITATPVRLDEQGRKVITAALDITERKQAEKALRESEARFREIFETAGVSVWIEDFSETKRALDELQSRGGEDLRRYLTEHPEFVKRAVEMIRIVDVNSETIRMFGAATKSELRDSLTKVFAPETEALVIDGFVALQEGRESLQTETTLTTLADRRLSVIFTMYFGPPDRDYSRVVVTITDITPQKETEQQLQTTSERLIAAIEALQAGVYEHRVPLDETTYHSPHWSKIIGYTPEELPPFGTFLDWLNERVHPEDREPLNRHYTDFIEGRSNRYDIEIRLRHKQGQWVWVRGYSVATERAPDGSVRRLVGLMFDVTRRKEVEEKLREMNDQLEQRVAQRTLELAVQNQRLRQLALQLTEAEQQERHRIAKMLHDGLQQLLVGGKMHLPFVLTERGPEIVDRLEKLFDEALTAARSLSYELSPPTLYSDPLPEALRWLAQWYYTNHRFDVDLTVDKDFPVLPDQIKVFLFEAIRELLFNAVKHSGLETGAVVLHRPEAKQIRVTVSDGGLGFDPAALEQHDTPLRGLGLFSIRERLIALGGSLQIESVPGDGAKFTLTVPVYPAETVERADVTNEIETPVLQADTGPEEKAGRPIRVLIVDDHAVVRQELATLLDYEADLEMVGQAADGLEAVEKAAELKPDVVIMDVDMPRMDGIEATGRIKKSQPEIMIIGLSIHEETVKGEKMRRAGASAYLSKRSGIQFLLKTIRDLF